ncbi:MAG: sulfotransferase [Bauldia sp.]
MLDTPNRETRSDLSTRVLDIVGYLGKQPKDLPEYYRRLLDDEDLYLRTGAMAALLDLGAVERGQWTTAVSLSRYGAIGRRAFYFFTQSREYALARQALDALATAERPDPVERMRADLALDSRSIGEFEARDFLATGEVSHLLSAAANFEAAAGWREAVLWAARATALHPIVPATAMLLLTLLESSNQPDLLDGILETFRRGNVFPLVRRIYRGVQLVERGKPDEAISQLSTIELKTVPTSQLRIAICGGLAKAHEKLGDYRSAAAAYRRQHEQIDGEKMDPADFMRSVRRLARIDVGEVGPDRRSDHFMMLGFPRSGTTLLENVLAAHPEIETFEEIPSYQSVAEASQAFEQAKFASPEERRAAAEAMRERYYVEIERRKRKAGARIFVDKLPIRSAYAESLEKFFPQKKYIFSIRHPYDVVLSCYRQSFKPNPAMENFRQFDKACALYDEVMSVWFKAFPGESERICYLRYDDLVTDFEAAVRRVLAFLGADWNEEVRAFSERSQERRVATPSYAKVRAGLSIGVQSSWRNYRFLFGSRETGHLDKWVERFGYKRLSDAE